jgi:hypothetical protein
VENDEEHTEKLRQTPIFKHLRGVSHDGLREQERCGHRYKTLAKGHVFEDGPIGKPTKLLEECATDKECLVAVNDPSVNATQIIQERDQLEPPIIAGEPVHEPTGLDGPVRFHLIEPLNCTKRQNRVGMKKEQPLARASFAPAFIWDARPLGAAKNCTSRNERIISIVRS